MKINQLTMTEMLAIAAGFMSTLITFEAHAEKTIWDELPKTMSGKYSYFEKQDVSDVFKTYKLMRGTKFIFTCANAHTFQTFAKQNDAVKDMATAEQIASDQCFEKMALFGMEIPIGTPILLAYERDYKASDAYQDSLKKWTPITANNQAQMFVYLGKPSITNDGNIGVWILGNYDNAAQTASSVSLREFDCKQRIFRITRISTFSEKYGRGEKLSDGTGEQKWASVMPGTLFESVLDHICATKQ